MTDTVAASAALLPHGLTGPTTVEIDDDGLIVSVQPARGPVPEGLLVPGFVDLQVNGIDDIDVSRASGADWERLDELLLTQGTTSWCPTLISAPLGSYAAPLRRIAAAMERAGDRPDVLGVHLEGPFLGDAIGAHRAADIVPVDLDWIAGLPPHVRLVTIGAEQPRAVEAIRSLRRRGVTVSIGHSRPDEPQFVTAVGAGASMVTHLFNGMSGVHHRDPGLAAFALTEPAVALGLIADLIHVHPRVVRLAFAMRPDDVVLVTDATAWRVGTVGSVRMSLVDGAPRLADGTLAGSCLTMDRAVANTVRSGVGLVDALRAASTNPARVIGADDRGVIEPGRRADFVLLDDSLVAGQVLVAGQRVR